TTGWTAVNPPMIVDQPGAHAVDPEQWQQLVLAEAETQNGIPVTAGVQGYIGANWGYVAPFAITGVVPGQPYLDLGGPPVGLDGDLANQAVDVLVKTAKLDPDLPETIDLSPGAYGDNTLGANDGDGHDVNGVTGQPYAPNVARVGDFARVLAEFWADGPKSETPPGHWFVLANEVADAPGFERRLWGEGPELDPLSWDVHTYLVLGGAVHDAAIAAWGLKRVYTSARPITLIRTMAERGQRSDPTAAAYDPDGLPLIPGVIELITAASSAPGERHAALARYEGEVAVMGWLGEPGDRANEIGGVGWMLGTEWIPYQRRTFVTPAFPGYVSGHSTFSRAAAETLTALTGSPWFPGGLSEFTAPAGNYLVFEDGPVDPVHLQWGTYQDAADQAGQSRLWGGIHIQVDDFHGRRIGYEVGHEAVDVARTWFDGTARP
ncbi:MAG TPA: vanadium-dependent haloperoxidase, partial [Myxococcota bacterium]|nr:vanadium-dependent haloperoxidase [Myxococcota bacterium]